MSSLRSIVVLLLLLLPVGVTWSQGRTYPPTFEGAREEVYKEVGDLKLKLWVFEPETHAANQARPAIVFFFGGGWKSGSPAQFEQHCRYLAGQGMVAITADYRVRERHQTLADRCVADAKSAIRWVRQHAGELGVDPNRIVAAGGSAGGHLAACTATIKTLDEPDEPAEISSLPNALALFNPALVIAPYGGVPDDPEKLADRASRTGVPPKQISPIHHLRAGLPPSIIFHGQADETVPFATAALYAKAAKKLGNRCELVGYPGAGHGFFNHGRNGDPGEHYLDTVFQLHRFLNSIGYLEEPPAKFTPDSANVHLRGRFKNTQRAIVEDKKATIAFMGGSITEMSGYRVMMEEWFRKTFPDTAFQFVNAGISSTCSTTGAFRLTRDVLSQKPDLLFVEFAVNDDQDAAHPREACVRGMEGVLRHALKANPSIDLVVTHFVNPPMLELLQRAETPVSISAHEEVAARYLASTVNLAKEVAERIESRELTWKEYGGTHPQPAGNAIAAEMMQDLLTSAWSEASDEVAGSGASTARRLAKPIDASSYADGRLLSIAEAKTDENWTLGVPKWGQIAGALRARFDTSELLCSTKVGAEIDLDFKGSAIGLYLLAGPDAGRVSYSIDGGPWEAKDLHHRFSKRLHYPRTVMLKDDLKPGPHRMKLRVGPAGDREGGGTAVRILAFAAN